jgi:ABC-2 type transport system permease protein
MCLELLRDRGALLLAFALPGIFFVIFAQIFATTASGELVITTAVADQAGSSDSARLLAALENSPRLRLLPRQSPDTARVAQQVRLGDADAGIVVRDGVDGQSLNVLLLTDPARGAAAQMLLGQIRQASTVLLPETAVRPPAGVQVTERSVFSAQRAIPQVAYAAGAVSFMFLLFASASGAMSLMEERESGIVDRVLAGPGGIDVLVVGKFLYLLVQGVMQVGVIFVLAWLGYDVALTAHPGEWLVVTVCAATTAAGLAMLLVTASATRRQAQTISTLVILVMSAIGGSMVPRYVMPPRFQSLGWLTPNTWAVEAYSGIFWREQTLQEVAVPCLVLLASGLLALALAVGLARRGARR